MGRNIAIGIQNFNEIIENNCFYVDKTNFIKEWWDSRDSVTLITRPRRFGKTLTMSMVEQFFSVDYTGRSDLFEGLKIWQEEDYREIQGTYPVISLSFASVKEKTYAQTKQATVPVYSMTVMYMIGQTGLIRLPHSNFRMQKWQPFVHRVNYTCR